MKHPKSKSTKQSKLNEIPSCALYSVDNEPPSSPVQICASPHCSLEFPRSPRTLSFRARRLSEWSLGCYPLQKRPLKGDVFSEVCTSTAAINHTAIHDCCSPNLPSFDLQDSLWSVQVCAECTTVSLRSISLCIQTNWILVSQGSLKD